MLVSPASCAPTSTSHASTSRATAPTSAQDAASSMHAASKPARSIASMIAPTLKNRRVRPRRMSMSRGLVPPPPDLHGSATLAPGAGRG